MVSDMHSEKLTNAKIVRQVGHILVRRACAHEEDYRKHCNEDNLNLWRQTIKDAMSKAASFDFSNIDDKVKDKTRLMCEV